MTEPTRNVVLVVMDSARADAIGKDTPIMSSLADDGTLFSRAIAPAGWTLPSHTSMFTGLSPSEHRILGLPGGSERVLANARARVKELIAREQLLAPKLQKAGVRTFSASASPWVTLASGLDAGFDVKDHFNFMQLPPRRTGSRLPKRLRQSVATIRSMGDHARWIAARRDKGATRVLEGMEHFIRSGSGPFFAFTTLMETHEPHLALPPDKRPPASILNAVLQPGIIRLVRLHAHNWGTVPLPSRLIHRWRAAYASEIRYLDRWIGRLMEMLDRTGVIEDTVVIITADHGELFNEDGWVGHGVSLSEGLARVPLVIRGPGIEGRRSVDSPVGLSAIGETIHGLITGASDPGVLDPVRQGRASMEVEHPAHVAHPPPLARRRAGGPGIALYDDDLKLVVDPFDTSGAPPQLFRVSNEQVEVPATNSEPTAWQRQELVRWRQRVGGSRA